MPCNCCGIRSETCNCKVLTTEYCKNGGVKFISHNKNNCPYLASKASESRVLQSNVLESKYFEAKQLVPKHSSHHTSNFMFRIVELFYEKCAAYNLRYCPIGGFTKHDGYFSNTLKDFLILVCFLVANFVVFLTISFKTLVHLYFVLIASAQWMVRHFEVEQSADTTIATQHEPRQSVSSIHSYVPTELAQTDP